MRSYQNWYSFVCNRLPLINLPSELLEALREGKISYTKARAIAKLKDPKHIEELLAQAIEKDLSLSQIRERIQALPLEKTNPATPQKKLDVTYRRLREAKLWKNPQKWKQIETLFKKIEALIEGET